MNCKVVLSLILLGGSISLTAQQEETVIIKTEVEKRVDPQGKVTIMVNGEEKSTDGTLLESIKGGEGHTIIKMDGEEIHIGEGLDVGREKKLTIITDGQFQSTPAHGFDVYQKIHPMNNGLLHQCLEPMESQPRMGVQIENVGGNGAIINEVFPNSAAQKAGLKKGDIIYKMGKHKVPNVQAVIDVLNGMEIGDVVKVSFLRNGKKTKKKVTLTAHPLESANMEISDSRFLGHHKPNVVKRRRVVQEATSDDPMTHGDSNVELFTLNLEYRNDVNQLTVTFEAEKVPTQVRILSATGEVLYQWHIEDFYGFFTQSIEITPAQKQGATLEIEQKGDKIVESL